MAASWVGLHLSVLSLYSFIVHIGPQWMGLSIGRSAKPQHMSDSDDGVIYNSYE